MKNYKCVGNCRITLRPTMINNRVIPSNTLYFINDGVLYFCTNFPNYHGSPNNVILTVFWYDTLDHTDGVTTLKGRKESRELFKSFVALNRPQRTREENITFRGYEKMMEHDRVHKKGSGGVRLIKNVDGKTEEERELTYFAKEPKFARATRIF